MNSDLTVEFSDDVYEKSIQDLIENIKEKSKTLSEGEKINLFFCSSGGHMEVAYYFFDFVRLFLEPDLRVIISGCADSAAFIMILAGEEVKCTENSHFLLHRITKGMNGTSDELRAATESGNFLEKRYRELVAENTEMEVRDIMEKMKDNTIVRPSEALELGIVDEII
ncbi:MAG: ATP-dependent Clp protease proteolytic subunit [Candidatus Magasanikbacteria bacterium]